MTDDPDIEYRNDGLLVMVHAMAAGGDNPVTACGRVPEEGHEGKNVPACPDCLKRVVKQAMADQHRLDMLTELMAGIGTVFGEAAQRLEELDEIFGTLEDDEEGAS